MIVAIFLWSPFQPDGYRFARMVVKSLLKAIAVLFYRYASWVAY